MPDTEIATRRVLVAQRADGPDLITVAPTAGVDPRAVQLTAGALSQYGGIPYRTSTDWQARLSLVYTIDSTGVLEGIDLTNVNLLWTCYNPRTEAVIFKSGDTGVSLAKGVQTTARSAGGFMGDVDLVLLNTAVPVAPGEWRWLITGTYTTPEPDLVEILAEGKITVLPAVPS